LLAPHSEASSTLHPADGGLEHRKRGLDLLEHREACCVLFVVVLHGSFIIVLLHHTSLLGRRGKKETAGIGKHCSNSHHASPHHVPSKEARRREDTEKKGSDVLSFFLSALVKTVGATIVSLHPTFSICGVGDRVYWRLLP
jgi:hypothetical protein